MPVSPLPAGLRSLRRRWAGFVVLHRRGLVALAVGLAVLSGLRALSPPPPPSTEVVVAAHDLPGGRVLSSDDLLVRRMPLDVAPEGASVEPTSVEGRTLAAPVRAGEPVTDRRVLGAGLLAAHPGTVAVPVRLPDPEVRGLLRVGDRIDLVAASPGARQPSSPTVSLSWRCRGPPARRRPRRALWWWSPCRSTRCSTSPAPLQRA